MVRKVGGTRKKATTKKATHHRSRRRRRISGVNDMSGMLEKAGGLILGAVAARELNTLVVKFFPSLAASPMMSGIGQMAVGFMLPKFVKGAFFQNMADGMIAEGGMVTIVSTGIITGTNNKMAYRVNGTSNLKVISGTSHLPVVSGTNQATRIQNFNPSKPARKFKPYV